MKLKIFLSLIVLCFIATFCVGQVIISGTVYDSTKIYSVSGVQVKSTNGSSVFTDSNGIYHIPLSEKDSISFFYRNKPTIKFPVATIPDYTQFDISLRVGVKEKYKPLREIIVYSNYRRDSAENRNEYYKAFNYQKPGIRSTYTPGSSAGLDVEEINNTFNFKKD